MRVDRGIERFLEWRQLERDATPRSTDSYARILWRLASRDPEATFADYEGQQGTERLREFLADWIRESRERRGEELSAATRSNIISVLHSFFAWAESEDLVDVDPSRKIRRPPKRKPSIRRPTPTDLDKLRAAATLYELPAILLLEGAGLRNSEIRSCRWQSIDLVNGRVHVHRKGNNWQWVPIAPDVLSELRRCFREIEPELDDYIFTVEVEQWVSSTERRRRRLDPKQPRSSQALGRMVKRVCGRAGVPEYSPHPLRHGFGNRFLRESGNNFFTLQGLLGHSSITTTEGYVDEISLDEQAEALQKAVEQRNAQASSNLTTPGDQPSSTLETEEWRRRESNPRPQPHRSERLQV